MFNRKSCGILMKKKEEKSLQSKSGNGYSLDVSCFYLFFLFVDLFILKMEKEAKAVWKH